MSAEQQHGPPPTTVPEGALPRQQGTQHGTTSVHPMEAKGQAQVAQVAVSPNAVPSTASQSRPVQSRMLQAAQWSQGRIAGEQFADLVNSANSENTSQPRAYIGRHRRRLPLWYRLMNRSDPEERSSPLNDTLKPISANQLVLEG